MSKEVICRKCGNDAFVGQPCDGLLCIECGATGDDIQGLGKGDILCHNCGLIVDNTYLDAFTCGETNEFIPDDEHNPTDKYENDKLA